MVKVDRDTIESLKAEWDKPLNYSSDEEDDVAAEPLSKKQRIQRPTEVPSPTSVASLRSGVGGAEGATSEAKVVKNNGKVRAPPPKEVTGVEPRVVELCASLSQQIYGVYSKDDFRLEASDGETTADVELLELDTHGDLNPTIPAFAVARAGDTLIMGWRGTNQILDFVTDVAIAPVHCSELGTAATGVRCHAMFSSFVASDLKVHQEKTIIPIIAKKGIKRIVFTGHSLGGGLANVAHLFVQAQIRGGYNESSPWAALGPLDLRTITFAAPMSVVDKDEVYEKNDHADKLLEDVGASTFNFVFKFDFVPRAYGHVGYINDMLQKVGPEAVRSKIHFGWISHTISEKILEFVKNTASPLIDVSVQFRHIGKLIYYPEADSENPLILTDNGPAYKNGESADKNHFNHYGFNSYRIQKRRYIEELLEAHSHFPRAFAAYISVPKEDKK